MGAPRGTRSGDSGSVAIVEIDSSLVKAACVIL
jgi:hypothetical protein